MEIIELLSKYVIFPLWNFILNLLNNETFIGVLIGGLITYFTSNKLLNKTNEIDAKATLKAILAEIKTLEYIFKTEFDTKIKEDKKIFWYSVPLGTDYFSIYHSNTSKIGKIKNNELRELVIQIYMTLKFFLDCLETNNNLIKEHNKLGDGSSISTVKGIFNGDLKLSVELLSKERKKIEKELQDSKTENILPTYTKLEELFEKIKELV